MSSSKRIKTIGKKVIDPEWLTSFAVAALNLNAGDAAKELSKLLKKDASDISDNLKSVFIDTFTEAINKKHHHKFRDEASSIPFNASLLNLQHPTLHPSFWACYRCLRNFLSEDEQISDGSIQDFHSFRTWFTQTFFDKLVATFGETTVAAIDAVRKIKNQSIEAQYQEHIGRILSENISSPLPIEPEVRLTDIYIIPQVQVVHLKEGGGLYWDQQASPEKKDDLIIELSRLLGQEETAKQGVPPELIILHGEPGHGKSSSLKMLIHYLLLKDIDKRKSEPVQILFYEFRSLGRLNTDMMSVLQRTTPFITDESFFQNRETVMIFDGMDEHQTSDDDREIRFFVDELVGLSRRLKSCNDKSCLRIVISARSQYFGYIQHIFRRPYHVLEIENFDASRLSVFLRRYRTLKNLSEEIINEKIMREYRLDSLMHQPILLTICSRLLSDETGRSLLSKNPLAEINRAEVHRVITRWTWERRWQDGLPFRIDIEWDTFRQILRMVGVTLFRLGRTEISTQELLFELYTERERFDLPLKSIESQDELDDILRKLTIGFFVDGATENKFWFIHATYRDYFAIDGILWLVKEAIGEFNPGKPETSLRKLADSMYFIFSSRALSAEDHKPFLKELLYSYHREGEPVRYINRNNSDELLHKKGIIDWLIPLRDLFYHSLMNHEFIADQSATEQSNLIQHEAYYLVNLLVLITEIFQTIQEDDSTKNTISKDLFETFNFSWLSDLYGFSEQAEHTLLSKLQLDFSNMDLENIELEFIMLKDAKFRNTNLTGATFSCADLGGGDFTNANFEGASITLTDFQKTRGITATQLNHANFLHQIAVDEDIRRDLDSKKGTSDETE